jgi:phosphohistidine phosphatase SixA
MMVRIQASLRRRAAILLLLVSALILPAVSFAQGAQSLKAKLSPQEIAKLLPAGGYTILLRHTSTTPYNPDSAEFDIQDCATQRNLSERGQAQARLLGESFKKLGIRVGDVLSSEYCRCMETGRLAFGKVEPSEVLRVGDSRPETGRNDPGIAIRKLLDTAPAAGKNNVFIAHSVTLLYAYGLTGKPEGIAHVFRPSGLGLGTAEYLGSVKPDEWPAIAGLSGGN